MPAGYNLRSAKRLDHQQCYIKQQSKDASIAAFSPKVTLERLKVLENIKNERFYIDNNRILTVKPTAKKSERVWTFNFFKFLFALILFIAVILIFINWKGYLSNYSLSVIKIQENFKDYFFNVIQFYKEDFQADSCLKG